MIIKKIKKNKGFVLLFAVMLSSIILAITLGIANIALKEVKFSISAKDANDAFFAADAGEEQALYNDNKATPNPYPSGATTNFVLSGLGSSGQGCANVVVDKTTATTTITSSGYNVGNPGCLPANPNSVERQLKVSY